MASIWRSTEAGPSAWWARAAAARRPSPGWSRDSRRRPAAASPLREPDCARRSADVIERCSAGSRWSFRIPRAPSTRGTRCGRQLMRPLMRLAGLDRDAASARALRAAPGGATSSLVPRPLSGGAERGRETAGGDSPSLRDGSAPGHLRRARLVAGRVRPGRADEPAARSPGRGGHVVPLHLARHRCGAARVAPDRGDVPGQARGAGRGGAGAFPALPPLHRGPALGRARSLPEFPGAPGPDQREGVRRRPRRCRAARSIRAVPAIWATSAGPSSRRGGCRSERRCSGRAHAGRPRPGRTPSAATSPTRSSRRCRQRRLRQASAPAEPAPADAPPEARP